MTVTPLTLRWNEVAVMEKLLRRHADVPGVPGIRAKLFEYMKRYPCERFALCADMPVRCGICGGAMVSDAGGWACPGDHGKRRSSGTGA